MIGGHALRELGHDRHTDDVDYLIYKEGAGLFITGEGEDLINAAAHPMMKKLWEAETGNDSGVASPQTLCELKAFALVQHCQNFNFAKADACEYDLKFLRRTFGVKPEAVKDYVSAGEYQEIIKAIK